MKFGLVRLWLEGLKKTPRMVLFSVLLGIIGALGAQLFLLMLHWAEAGLLVPIAGYADITVPQAHQMGHAPVHGTWRWLIPVATALGGLISGVLVYTFAPEAEGHGTDAAVKAFHQTGGTMRARVPLIKSVASAITIGSGGSAGREGPTAQIAAGIGAILGQVFNLSPDERRLLVLTGMAAGLSAIFKSPLGTAIFAVEILYSGMYFEGEALVYTLIASAVAYALTGLFEGWTPLFILPPDVRFTQPIELGWYALLAVAAGLVGAVLPTIFYRMRDWFAAWPLPNHIKPAIGAGVLGLLGIVAPPLLGGGYGYIQFALEGGAGLALWVMLLLSLGKIVALSLTVSSGGSGGVFAPSLYVGAMLGAAVGVLLHMLDFSAVHVTGLAVVGMAAVFAGAARVPIASLVMVAEMTGGYHLIMPSMLAVAISYMVQIWLTRNVKYPSLYEAQVPAPHDSPVHRASHYQRVVDLLRDRRLELDDDILFDSLWQKLKAGKAIPLRRQASGKYVFAVDVRSGDGGIHQQIRDLDLGQAVILSIDRQGEEFVPSADTSIEPGDKLLIAAGKNALETLEPLFAGAGRVRETVASA